MQNKSVEQRAAELLPCECGSETRRTDGWHDAYCPVQFRSAVAATLAEVDTERLRMWKSDVDKAAAEAAALREQVERLAAAAEARNEQDKLREQAARVEGLRRAQCLCREVREEYANGKVTPKWTVDAVVLRIDAEIAALERGKGE